MIFSVAIANTISLLNPEKVVIGGGVSDSMGICDSADSRGGWQAYANSGGYLFGNLGGKAGALGAINFASKKSKSRTYR